MQLKIVQDNMLGYTGPFAGVAFTAGVSEQVSAIKVNEIAALLGVVNNADDSAVGEIAAIAARQLAVAPSAVDETPDTTNDLDALYSQTLTVTDGIDCYFEFPTLPSWLTAVDNGDNTCTISGTPETGTVAADDYDVVVKVWERSGNVDDKYFLVEWTITVS